MGQMLGFVVIVILYAVIGLMAAAGRHLYRPENPRPYGGWKVLPSWLPSQSLCRALAYQ